MPVLAIASHIPREEIGGNYFQETHPQELFRECSVYCELVSIPGQLPRILEIAMRTALQRGGVAVVVIPGEVFLADGPHGAKPAPVREASSGLAMLLGELITLRQLHLPVKVVVFNNGALSFVELEMKAAGIVTYGTDLDNPDFAGIARSAGLFGATVAKAGELEDALRAAFDHDGPALVDVRTTRHELSLPPKLTYGEIKGFTLYATRTILAGAGEELVELARTNLRDLDIE